MEFTTSHSGIQRARVGDIEIVVDFFDYIPKTEDSSRKEEHRRRITILREVGPQVLDPVHQRSRSGFERYWEVDMPPETSIEALRAEAQRIAEDSFIHSP